MARQFTSEDLVRLLLNVERSVVREALTDERLSAHEIWLEKGVILEAIARIGTQEAPANTREIFLSIFTDVILAVIGAAEILRDAATGPVIGKLFKLFMGGIISLLEAVLLSLKELAQAPPTIPDLTEFDLVPPQPAPVPDPINPQVVILLKSARLALINQLIVLEALRVKVHELFFAIDPVFSLAQGPILVLINDADRGRADSLSEIERALRLI